MKMDKHPIDIFAEEMGFIITEVMTSTRENNWKIDPTKKGIKFTPLDLSTVFAPTKEDAKDTLWQKILDAIEKAKEANIND